MAKFDYPILAAWAVPPREGEQATDVTDGMYFPSIATAFMNNFERVRSLANLPAVVAAQSFSLGKTDKLDTVGWEDGAKQVEEYTSKINSVKYGIESVLTSVLVGAWTTFEVLSGDLWTETVNQFPILGVRALDADPLEGDSDSVKERKAGKTVSVVAQKVLDPKFDLKQKMGDVLSDAFPMTKFSLVVHAYKAVFRDDALCEIIRHRDIRTLSAARNVLVHNAGNADEDFCNKVKTDPRFSKFKVGERIELSSATTVALLKSLRRQSVALLNYVAKWCVSKQKANQPPIIKLSPTASTTAAE